MNRLNLYTATGHRSPDPSQTPFPEKLDEQCDDGSGRLALSEPIGSSLFSLASLFDGGERSNNMYRSVQGVYIELFVYRGVFA